MKLGLQLRTDTNPFSIDMDLIHAVEDYGFHSVWVSEAYGHDAITPCAWILARTRRIHCGSAVLQIPARTPTMAAMTAMTLDALSGGRFILGVGSSSARVTEGWHGQRYGKPQTRTREYIEIVRAVLKRDAPLVFEGEEYQIPYQGPGALGLGRPLKSFLHGNPGLQIYTGTVSPGGLRVAAEVADGVIPLFMDPERYDIFEPDLAAGFAHAGGGKDRSRFNIAPLVFVAQDDDLARARMAAKRQLFPYLGAMGARAGYYAAYARRLGHEAGIERMRALHAEGHLEDAIAAIPDALCDAVSLLGSADRIRDRLGRWKVAAAKHHVSTMLIGGASRETLRLIADEMLRD